MVTNQQIDIYFADVNKIHHETTVLNQMVSQNSQGIYSIGDSSSSIFADGGIVFLSHVKIYSGAGLLVPNSVDWSDEKCKLLVKFG
jgi:hypothetical protein